MDTGQHWALCWVTPGNCVWHTKWQRASRADHSKFAQNSCDDNKSRAGTVSSSLNHFHTRSPGWAGSVWGDDDNHSQTQVCRAKTHSWDIVIRTQYTLWSLLLMYLHSTLIFAQKTATMIISGEKCAVLNLISFQAASPQLSRCSSESGRNSFALICI